MAIHIAAAGHVDPSRAPDQQQLTISEEVTDAEWDRFVAGHPDGTIDHRWGWRDVFRDVFGHESTYLAARRGDQLVGVLPLVRFRSWLFGRLFVSLPFLNYGGVLASDGDAADGLIARARALAQEFRASHIELRHRTRLTGHLPYRQHKLQLTRPLPMTPEELWAGLDRKVRNQVRKAQKDGLVAEHGGAELLEDFYSVFSRNMRDLGTPVYPRALFRQALHLFSSDARVHVVRHRTLPVAASIAFRHRDTVLVPWASSRRDHRQYCPNMLLYWDMLENAVHAGARIFDFGRSSAGAGAHHFKRQWGARERPMYWEYLLLGRVQPPNHGLENARFAMAAQVWQQLPLQVANWLGPRVVRQIP